jgi:hypothetical protein
LFSVKTKWRESLNILLTYIVFYFKYVFLFFKYFQSSARRRTQGLFNADWETSKLKEKYYRSIFSIIILFHLCNS